MRLEKGGRRLAKKRKGAGIIVAASSYEPLTEAVETAVEGQEGDRAWKAERDLIHGVLEKYGQIEWTRSGRS